MYEKAQEVAQQQKQGAQYVGKSVSYRLEFRVWGFERISTLNWYKKE
jgi:hypothetical protein